VISVLKESRRPFVTFIALVLVLGLLIPVISPAMAQPPCNIKYMVVQTNQLVPGPLVAPGSYYVWFGLSRYNQWLRYGPFTIRGGHKYLVAPDFTDKIARVFEDHVDLSSYPYPTSDVAAIYYRTYDPQDYYYQITVCP
jgi:hypothetical protein